MVIISITGVLMQKYLPFIMYYGSAFLLSTLFTNILTEYCMFGHQTLLVYKIPDLYLLQYLRYWDSK